METGALDDSEDSESNVAKDNTGDKHPTQVAARIATKGEENTDNKERTIV